MATLKHADSKKNMYSWWWNSHISPKNSKWLQENLTDMDVKVKSMIKLIEEDADSFARRAEMYYKKRPELMKLVEEFYRAYRALAERYDHATGALRQAHQTMAEAFPNQVPFNPDDSPAANSDADPRTPEMSTAARALFKSEDFQKNALGLSSSSPYYGGKRNGSFSEESEGRVRKGLNFNMADEDGALSKSNQGGKMEKEILGLKESLAKIEAEKEAALIQYEESLERLSKLGLEVTLTQKNSKETSERASKAEAEAQALKESLSRLEDETECSLLQYRECLERITVLENDLSQAKEVEKEAESLKPQLAKLEAEKDAVLDQYKQSLKMTTDLEEKLRHAEEDARNFSERAEKAEGEVENLKQMIAKLTEEKEAEGVLYQQCLKTIASLEHKLLLAQEEAERLNGEIDDGVAKLKGAEEQCVVLERSNQSLHAELESMVLQMGSQSQELTEKQKELGRLWTSVQEERLRFVEAETAFQTLQHLHSQAQEELRSLASELQSRAHILKDMETRNQSLQDEILSYKEENKNLNELNLASATLTKDMRDEIFSLKESKGKLEDEIDLRTDQRNALQQEIYCLKEELNEMNRKHRVILEQVDAVGLNPECLGSSVKELQDDNLNLKEVCQRERSERLALLEKLQIKESSLSDLQEEILKYKEENKNLSEVNLASAVLTKSMRDEIFSLKESKEKLEEEVDRRVDQGNALQLEIDSLKEELNELNRKHHVILEQVEAVGLKPESIGSSVKALQDENKNLQEVSQREGSEKLALLEKLAIMGQLLEKNAVLENSLSDLSAELDGVRGKLKVIEDSCRSLLEEKSTLADEKASLLDQLRVTTEDLMKLSETNSFMENWLSDANAELEVLKPKSKSLEDSCQLLTVEKFALITEKGSLVSEIEITQGSLKDLEIRYAELEEKCSAVEREKASTLSKVKELERSLAVQKQEHDRYAQMNEEQLAVMEGRIRKLKEEGAKTRKEFEEEVNIGFSLQTETFILARCIQDLEESNHSLVNDFQKLLEASKSSEKLIYVLEQEKTGNQVTIKSLSDHINALRGQMHQLLLVFGISVDRECEDKNVHDQTCLSDILSKAEYTKNALFETEDESRQLAVEVSILVTLLRQLRTELADLESEKNSLDQELSAKSEKLLELQGEAHKLHKRNEELGSKLIVGEQEEEVLIAQIENLRGELLEVHGAYGNLQTENLQVRKEKKMLMKELSDVEDRVHDVEGQNSNFIDELYDQSILVLVLKSCLEEKSVAMCGLGEDLDKLNGVNNELLEKLTIMDRELEGLQTENQDLKETLQKSEHELKTVAFVSDKLTGEILNVKNLLAQKEREFLEAEEKLKLTESEKTELYGIVEDLKRECDEVKMTNEEQGKQILELSDTNTRLSEEQISLQEASQMLELELNQLREEHEKTISELEKETNGVKVLESQAEQIYGELQTSSIYQALLVLKVRELAESFVSLQEREAGLESENGGLKSQLASYGSALVSLRDSIVSLENHASLRTEEQRSNEDAKGAESVNDRSVEGSDKYSDFLDIQNRIKTIEKTLVELESLRMKENTDASTKLESLTRQMEELKLQRSYHRRERKPTSEILEVGTKDIVLDQESESSSHEKSKREDENQNQMLELWETTYQDGNIDLTVGKSKRTVKPKSEDIMMEKELGVDKLEISKRFKEPREGGGNKRKVLERLNSDDQKLTNLHITVQDLKKKVEITEKGQRGKAGAQCELIKAQLEEAEADIEKLFDLTAKLMKNIEDSSFSPEKNSATEIEESKSNRRKRTSEQARRISEKIGRLQLEVQKIQFALVKLDDDKESKGRSRYLDTQRRVLLKDYLYSGGRTKATIHRKKKAPFCACIDPPISD